MIINIAYVDWEIFKRKIEKNDNSEIDRYVVLGHLCTKKDAIDTILDYSNRTGILIDTYDLDSRRPLSEEGYLSSWTANTIETLPDDLRTFCHVALAWIPKEMASGIYNKIDRKDKK